MTTIKYISLCLIATFIYTNLAFANAVPNREDSGIAHYPAKQSEGIIGTTANQPADSPTDNVFQVEIDQSFMGNEQIWLTYDLYGVQDHTAVSRSINDQLSVGGHIVRVTGEWTQQKERIHPEWLKEGTNIIRFTLPEDARHSYQIRNLSIDVQTAETTTNQRQIIINQPTATYYDNKAYIKGLVTGEGSDQAKIYINRQEATIVNGEFEMILDKPAGKSAEAWSADLMAVYPDNQTVREYIDFTESSFADIQYGFNKKLAYAEKIYTPQSSVSIQLGGATFQAEPGALLMSKKISITALRHRDIPALDHTMSNVTDMDKAYRFLPHGTKFLKETKIHLEYDPDKIPAGYTEKDIRTFYFDEAQRKWLALPLDSIDRENNIVISRTTHFTDMINGVIQVPESPETTAYTPTSIKDIKAANPSANINLIQPPTANNMGNANLSYPINIPAGRQGMQPSLAITYNSGGGNGWLGLGWDLSVPMITIDTRWGVPRYDPAKETETYSIMGQQLYPVAHRDQLKDRESNKMFHPRVEGAFNKIIRHGANPNEYWWEVIDKNGTKYFYGGVDSTAFGATLKGEGIYGQTGVACWALVRVEDINGNYVTYKYDKVETLNPDQTINYKQLYCEEINYTRHISTSNDEGAYKIKFDRIVGTRPDIEIDARLGFKRGTADLLREIAVEYEGDSGTEQVRRYQLNYERGAFFKTLLSTIQEYDANDSLFYEHTLDYYDDVRDDNGNYQPYGAAIGWSLSTNDVVNANFPSIRDGFTDVSSSIGGSASDGRTIGGAVTLGFNDGSNTKSWSLGGEYSNSVYNTSGMLSLIDINGDGLPDKVYKDNGGVKFRPNLSGTSSMTAFGPPINLTIDDFLKSKSVDNSFGFQGNGPPAVLNLFLGINTSLNVNRTSTYFSDVNGDGLVDLVNGTNVLYNRTDNFNNITFMNSSVGSENEIYSTGTIMAEPMDSEDSTEIDMLYAMNPLHDIVKMWRAPWSGKIKVSGNPNLLEDTSPARMNYDKADGVHFSIQHQDTIKWAITPTIDGDDYGSYSINGEDSLGIHVFEGERIYFRVSSREDGAYDRVNWNPIVEYIDIGSDVSDLKNANGKPIYKFTASEDFILTSSQEFSFPIDGEVRIETATLFKPITSDAVKFELINTQKGHTVWSQQYAGNDTEDLQNIEIFPNFRAIPHEDSVYQFRISSSTNVRWEAIKWEPVVSYVTSFDSNFPNVVINGESIIKFDIVPEYTIYPTIIDSTTVWIASEDGMVDISPQLAVDTQNPVEGTIIFSVKKYNQLLHEELLTIDEYGIITSSSPGGTQIQVEEDSLYYLEYHTSDINLVSSITSNTAEIDGDIVQAGLYTKAIESEAIFGPMYRNWGHFAYNSSGRVMDPINQGDLNTNALMDGGIDSPDVGDTSYFNTTQGDANNTDFYNPASAGFAMLVPNPASQSWMGMEDSIYVKASTMSCSRMGIDDLTQFTPTQNEPGERGVSKKSRAWTLAFSASFAFSLRDTLIEPSDTIPVYFSANDSLAGSLIFPPDTTVSFSSIPTNFSPGFNYSVGIDRNKRDFMDMNGDRYPDVLNKKDIQYTTMLGDIGEVINNPSNLKHNRRTLNQSFGLNAGGSYLRATKTGTTKSGHSIEASSSAGLTGSYAWNKSRTKFVRMDINGDGLPDRVYNRGSVRFNLGYTSTNEIYFGHEKYLNVGTSNTLGWGDNSQNSIFSPNNGESVNLVNGSFTFGNSFNRSEDKVKKILQDINGDGLVDILIRSNSEPLRVRFNTGSGFEPAITWNSLSEINTGVSTSFNENYALTITIKVPFAKIAVNPSFVKGYRASRQESTIMDVNGDGFPDYLESDEANNLTVRLSTIHRTNLLKTIHSPLGSEITIDYIREGNTYEMPNSVYTMSSVKVFDGLADDGGADTLLTTYEYDNGYYDRREREFYGFETLTTNQRNTLDNNSLYRYTVQTFENRNYYKKGLVTQEMMYDTEDNPYTETINTYKIYDIDSGTDLGINFNTDSNSVFVAVDTTIQRFYEGQATAEQSTTTIYNDYDEYGNILKFTDQGDPNNAEDDYKVEIEYRPDNGNYLVALPTEVEVTGGTSNQLYRQRKATYDSNGNLTQVQQLIEGSTYAIHDIGYDMYGNIDTLTRPPNDNGEQFGIGYTYDDTLYTYPIAVRNSYGYTSTAEYDLRFGQVTNTTSINGHEINYALDAKGRITEIQSPYPNNRTCSGDVRDYTIMFEYFPDGDANSDDPYAITSHYDPQYPCNDIQTATFIDGLSRVVQVKKDAAIYNESIGMNVDSLIVSGRITFDAFGRTVRARHPVTNDINELRTFDRDSSNIYISRTRYDVLDRTISAELPDGSITTTDYDFGQFNGRTYFQTLVTDANTNAPANDTLVTGRGITYAYTDVRGRQIATRQKLGSDYLISRYEYDAINQLLAAYDHFDNAIESEYDLLGRRTMRIHPDADTTLYTYDNASNLINLQTQNLLNENDTITYEYEFERLIGINYPKYPENDVTYVYGNASQANLDNNAVGRIIEQTDATGLQQFRYGVLGEVIWNRRIISVPEHFDREFITQWGYDTWNRLDSIIYPDGEIVHYNYNRGGLLDNVHGEKLGTDYPYVNQLGYDEFEQRVYLQYGNGTETTYEYEPDRRRLSNLIAETSSDREMMNNVYQYDAVTNISRIFNNAEVPTSETHMGGSSYQAFTYDDVYRLTDASGSWDGYQQRHRYSLSMMYNELHDIEIKNQFHEVQAFGEPQFVVNEATTYLNDYDYANSDQPHTATIIGNKDYDYDANGNLTKWEDTETGAQRNLIWDEENRLHAVQENGAIHRYTYDASGERVIKKRGVGQEVFVNGFPAANEQEDSPYIVYVNPYLVVRGNGYTKHIFIESQRIVSKIGNGDNLAGAGADTTGTVSPFSVTSDFWGTWLNLNDEWGDGLDSVYNGDWAWYAEAIGLDTMFNAAENYFGNAIDPWSTDTISGVSWNTFGDGLVNWNHLGLLGEFADYATETEVLQYFYHPDHLGSSSFITDINGEVHQHIEYLPFGETLVEEHTNNDRTPYRFNAKELDQETGYYYYGARYYNPQSSRWLSVDPMTEKHAGWTPYRYGFNNPVRFTDPAGMVEYDSYYHNWKEPIAVTYMDSADKLGVNLSTIKAVYKVETGGSSFRANGDPKILFERHYFSRLTEGKYDKTNPNISNPDWGGYGKYSEQLGRLNKAVGLDKEAGYKSASYGGFQIMGANYKKAGYDNVESFASDMMSTDIGKHIKAFTNFVNSNKKMKKALQKRDWAAFARLYNGPKYKENKYDTKLKDAYEKIEHVRPKYPHGRMDRSGGGNGYQTEH